MTGATRPSSPPEGDEDLSLLTRYARMLAERPAWRWHGRVVEAVGQVIKSEGPFCTVGECCEILDDSGARHAGEVIGFRGNQVLAMPIDRLGAIHYGNAVAAL